MLGTLALDRLIRGIVGSGIDLSGWKPGFVLRRLQRGALVSGDVFLDRHVDRLLADRPSLEAFLDDLSIGVTDFFRDTLAFAELEEVALPELARRTSAPRVLSLGCAQGQEPWSLAMLLAERFDDFEVLALDRKASFLDAAREGVYLASELERVSLGRVTRFFTRAAESFSISPTLRPYVQFALHDLADGALPAHFVDRSFDLVLCRNVVIYLAEPARHTLMDSIRRVLKQGGTLMLGAADSVPSPAAFSRRAASVPLFGLDR